MKQILQYLWLEKYAGLENFEINFTSRAKFHYDKDKNCIINLHNNKSEFEPDFFSDNIELSCIVGMNGTCKTTILRAIKEIFSHEYGGVSTNCIAIVYIKEDDEDDNEEKSIEKYIGWYRLSNGRDNHEKITCCKELELRDIDDKKSIYGCSIGEYNKNKIVKTTAHFDIGARRYVYISDNLTSRLYCQPMGEDELSTTQLIYKERMDSEEKHQDHVNLYFLKEFETQMKLVSEYGEILKDFGIRYSPYVMASIPIYKNIYYDLVDKIKDRSERRKEIYDEIFTDTDTNDRVTIFKNRLAEAIFLNIIYCLANSTPEIDTNEVEEIIECLLINKQDTPWATIKAFILSDEVKPKYQQSFFAYQKNQYRDFVNFIDSSDILSKKKTAFFQFALNGRFIIPTKTLTNSIDYDFLCNIETFWLKYQKISGLRSFINFSWGLSSGETYLLNVFSRLYCKCRKNSNKRYYIPEVDNNKEAENIVLLLDEIEVALHPEWQRKIVHSIIKFVEYSFTNTYTQIILATHSPIVLSDIPKQNTVLLKRDEQGHVSCIDGTETFGANIYSLYNNAFFMESGVIGEFARNKIKILISDINERLKTPEKVLKIISMIGDEYLRNEVYQIFIRNYGKINSSKNDRIEEMKKLRDSIDAEIKNLENNND